MQMTGNKLLLDTNIVIELFKGNQNVITMLDKQEKVYLPTPVLGELYLGAYRSNNIPKKLEEIKHFLERCIVLYSDATTADKYALIKTNLLKKGKPIPENDIWIAATALHYQLPIFTFDAHFEEVEGLVLTK
jgi:tRNA(fMet)-specific endonuclease VapC